MCKWCLIFRQTHAHKCLTLQQCSDKDLSNKTVYPTFARTLPPSGKIAKSIVSVLKHYNWNRVVVITSKNVLYEPISAAFEVRHYRYLI